MTYPIPDSVLVHHAAFLGKTRSGKTSSAKTAVERFAAAGERVCILDPIKSDWWGLTSSPDGRSPGLPFQILGGPHGHVPLHSTSGKVIGELVGSGALPLSIIDMALFEPGGLQRFFCDFADTLMRKQRGVLHLVIEEAHEFAPKERTGFGSENMAIHFAKKLATAGGSKGIRLIVATQSVQQLHNRVLGSCETMVAHRLTAPADQKPVVDWLKANVQKGLAAEIAQSLASLPTGTAWVCSGEAQLFEKVAFPRIATFDNSATPMSDDEAAKVTTAPVDIERLRGLIGDAVAEVEANDPKRLKAEIARLTRELAANKGGGADEAELIRIEGERDDLLGEVERLTIERDKFKSASEEYWRRIKACGHALGYRSMDDLDDEEWAASLKQIPAAAPARETRPIAPGRDSAASGGARQAPAAPVRRSPAAPSDGEVPAGCAKPLAALAAVYPSGLTEPQWATAAGYKRSGGTWGTYKSRLRGADLIESREGRWFATEAGASAVGDVELPPPPGPDLVRWWAAKLPGTSKMAEALIEAWPQTMSREGLADALGMAASGGSFGTYLSRLAGPGLIERGRDGVRLSVEVMG